MAKLLHFRTLILIIATLILPQSFRRIWLVVQLASKLKNGVLVANCSFIQGVHKVGEHFKKYITFIVFATEIICKKDLKEVN